MQLLLPLLAFSAARFAAAEIRSDACPDGYGWVTPAPFDSASTDAPSYDLGECMTLQYKSPWPSINIAYVGYDYEDFVFIDAHEMSDEHHWYVNVNASRNTCGKFYMYFEDSTDSDKYCLSKIWTVTNPPPGTPVNPNNPTSSSGATPASITSNSPPLIPGISTTTGPSSPPSAQITSSVTSSGTSPTTSSVATSGTNIIPILPLTEPVKTGSATSPISTFTSTPTSQPGLNHGQKLGLGLGLGLGLFFLIALLALCCCLFRRRRAAAANPPQADCEPIVERSDSTAAAARWLGFGAIGGHSGNGGSGGNETHQREEMRTSSDAADGMIVGGRGGGGGGYVDAEAQTSEVSLHRRVFGGSWGGSSCGHNHEGDSMPSLWCDASSRRERTEREVDIVAAFDALETRHECALGGDGCECPCDECAGVQREERSERSSSWCAACEGCDDGVAWIEEQQEERIVESDVTETRELVQTRELIQTGESEVLERTFDPFEESMGEAEDDLNVSGTYEAGQVRLGEVAKRASEIVTVEGGMRASDSAAWFKETGAQSASFASGHGDCGQEAELMRRVDGQAGGSNAFWSVDADGRGLAIVSGSASAALATSASRGGLSRLVSLGGRSEETVEETVYEEQVTTSTEAFTTTIMEEVETMEITEMTEVTKVTEVIEVTEMTETTEMVYEASTLVVSKAFEHEASSTNVGIRAVQ